MKTHRGTDQTHPSPPFLPPALAGFPSPIFTTPLHPYLTDILPPPGIRDDNNVHRPAVQVIHLLTAATLNHLARTFVPWLGQWIWHAHPLDDLRLAVSNPEVFLQEMLGYPWSWVVVSCLQKAGWDLVVGLLLGVLVEGRDRRERGGGERSESDGESMIETKGKGKLGIGRGGKVDDQDREVWTDMASVGYLVWMMVTAEYVFARAMSTAAWLVACYRLLTGGEVGRAALARVLKDNLIKIAFAMWQLGWYLRHGVWPLVLRSVSCAARGQPGLLMAIFGGVGSVMALLKYRSTFYIALEISGMFVFLGFILAGLVFLRLGSAPECAKQTASSAG